MFVGIRVRNLLYKLNKLHINNLPVLEHSWEIPLDKLIYTSVKPSIIYNVPQLSRN